MIIYFEEIREIWEIKGYFNYWEGILVENFKGIMELVNCEVEGKCKILKGLERICIFFEVLGKMLFFY